MNEEIDENIYHQDFTTVSEWEVFIAHIEEILNEWQLSKSLVTEPAKSYTKKWIMKTEEILFHGIKFVLSYHALEPIMEAETSVVSGDKAIITELHNGLWDSTTCFMDDVDGSPYPVSRWYGLRRYLMLCSSIPLTEGNLIRLVMSTVNIAFANIDCGVPLFVKIREHWQHSYLGFYEDSEYKINFDTIHLKRISNQCSHLSGLVSLFKSKIASPIALGAVIISAKFSYELKDADAFIWRKTTNSNEFLSIDGFDVKKLTDLPFGSEKNPIHSVLLNAIWPRFRESAMVESSTFSEIDAIMAPTWTITLKMRDNYNCQLSEVINKVMDLLENNNLLMDTLGLSKSLGIINPLHKITEAPITISKLVKAAIGQGKNITDFKGPIADDLLMPLLYYIFPDAVEDDNLNYHQQLEVEFKQADGEQRLCSYVKTSPEGGLVWRLSVTAARLYDAGGLPYLAHLWYEFVQELQYRWEHRILIPGHNYYKVSCIIDCLEIDIQKPSKALHQALTWSEYKKGNTVKYLISCTPNGLVNFVSQGFGGRTSDVAVVENCKFLDGLQQGTVILADRGFKHLEQVLNEKGMKLLRPPSVSTGEKLSKDQVRQTKIIASLRIHIERVIRRIREFHMLKQHSVINLNILRVLDHAIIIACALINLQDSIIR